MRQIVFFAIAVSLLTGCPFIDRHFEKVDYAAGTTGAVLNDRFERLVKVCHVVPDKEKAKEADYKGHNYLPNNIALTEQELKSIPIVEEWHSSWLFLYPFTKAEMQSFITATAARAVLNPNHLLSEQTVADPQLGLDLLPHSKPGMDAFLYRQSCASYVSARAGGGVSFPLASVQSALDSQYGAGGRAALASGFFESPFSMMLDGGGAQARYARLLLWEQMRKTPDLQADLYVISGFSGAIFMGSDATSSGTKVKLDATAGGSVGVFSGKADLSATYEQDSDYSGHAFRTLIFSLPPGSFRALESPDGIKAAIRTQFISPAANPVGPMVSGKKHEHRLVVAGIPKSICESTGWTAASVSPAVYDGLPSVQGVASFDAALSLPQCIFVVKGMPSNAVMTNQIPPIVSYTLISGATLTVNAVGTSLELPVENVELKVNPNPQLIPLGASLVPSAEASGTSLRWKWNVPFEVRDEGNPIDHGKQMAVKVDKLRCRQREVDVMADSARDLVTQQYGLTIRTVNPTQAGATGFTTEACRAKVEFVITVVDGQQVKRSMDLVLDVPKEAEARILGAPQLTEAEVKSIVDRYDQIQKAQTQLRKHLLLLQ